MLPVLPDEIADLLDDATPASGAASDAEVDAFMEKHNTLSRPEVLTGWVSALANHFAAHASRHQSTLTVLTGAMKEARLGLYPAKAAAFDTIRPMFINEVAKPPASRHQNAARTGKTASLEFYDILKWAVAQANAADLDDVQARVDAHVPDNVRVEVVTDNVGAVFGAAALKNAATATGSTKSSSTNSAQTKAKRKAKRKAKAAFVDGASFILDIPTRIPALWGQGTEVLWAEGESLMIAAPLGLGKTTLGGLLLRSQLGLGDKFLLGHPVPARDGKILYLAMDRPQQVARAMHRQFTEADRAVLADRLIIRKGPPPADVAKNPKLLAWLAKKADAKTVFLDSIKDAALGVSDDEVGAGYNRARQHLLSKGVQLCEQHHTVKRGAKGGAPLTVADVYGSTWITSGTGSIILLTGDPGDPIVGFLHLRAPADAVGPYKVLHDQAAGTFDIYHRTDLLAVVATKGIYGLNARDAAVVIFDTTKPTISQVEKARRRLDKLVDSGALKRVDGTKGGVQGGSPTVWFVT